MGALSPGWVFAGLVLMGLMECGDTEWGAHPGQVCSGPEMSLQTIASGADLAGWWRVVESERETLGSWYNDYLLIDAALHPRAWSSSGGADYEKFQRNRSEWAFGCTSYLDHPLVVGQENRASDGVRTSFPRRDCQGDDYIYDSGSRRVLDSVFREGDMLCFRYEQFSFKNDTTKYPSGSHIQRDQICFGYDREKDQVRIAYGPWDRPLVEHRYGRLASEHLGTSGDLSDRQLVTTSSRRALADETSVGRGAGTLAPVSSSNDRRTAP